MLDILTDAAEHMDAAGTGVEPRDSDMASDSGDIESNSISPKKMIGILNDDALHMDASTGVELDMAFFSDDIANYI